MAALIAKGMRDGCTVYCGFLLLSRPVPGLSPADVATRIPPIWSHPCPKTPPLAVCVRTTMVSRARTDADVINSRHFAKHFVWRDGPKRDRRRSHPALDPPHSAAFPAVPPLMGPGPQNNYFRQHSIVTKLPQLQ